MTTSRSQMISGMLGFSVGTIPFTYLGCPIFKGKPKGVFFQSITDRIKVKLATWKGTMLSIMGRVQVVKSIIHGMLVYSFHIYMRLRRLLHQLDSWIKNFIWSGDIFTHKICTVSWKIMCRPWAAGGLDLKPTRLINESLILQLAWCFSSKNSQWSGMLRKRFFKNGVPLQHYFKSLVWCVMTEHMGTIAANSLWIVGTGENIHFWTDNWLGNWLVDMLHVAPNIHSHLLSLVADVIVDGGWNISTNILDALGVAERLKSIVLPTTILQVSLIWFHSSNGKLSAKQAFAFLRPVDFDIPFTLIWKPCIPPSHSFILWLIMHAKMPTDENLRLRSCIIVSVCSFCLRTDESSDHLFLRCTFAWALWHWLGGLLNVVFDVTSFQSIYQAVLRHCSSQARDVFVAAVVHTLHHIRLSRNSLRFSMSTVTVHAAQTRIHAYISLSGNISGEKCIASDVKLLDAFSVSLHNRRIRDIMLVCWKAPSSPWLKVNTNGSVIGILTACGAWFCDYIGTFLCTFSCNIGISTIFNAEIHGLILALEYASRNGWRHVWL